MQLKLFYSHAWADKAGARVKKLLVFLQKDDEVWLDKKQIDLGDHINDRVAAGIDACDIFICIWSSQAFKSIGVQYEIDMAVKLKRPILVLLIEKFDIDHSPHLSGKEYVDFSGDDLQFDTQLVYLQNYLLRKRLAKMKGGSLQDNQRQVEMLVEKTELLKGLLNEVEDIKKRQDMMASGNDHSNVYIQETMKAFDKTLTSQSDEEKILQAFSESIKDISSKYPLKKDDVLKKQLTLETILKVDPDGSVPQLSQLRDVLTNDIAIQNTLQKTSVSKPGTQFLQNEDMLLVKLYKENVETTRQLVLAKAKSPFALIPALGFLSSVSTAAADFEMSYITGSPAILEKLYTVAKASNKNELQTLVCILIRNITHENMEKATASKAIAAFMPYAYIINNTARLLVQAGAIKQDEISFSLLSSFGVDKVSKFFFRQDWKEKSEKFLDIVKDNFGIEDKNLKWMKTAAAVIGVVLVADVLTDSGAADTGTISPLSTGTEPIYFEDKMAAMGFSVPSSIQY